MNWPKPPNGNRIRSWEAARRARADLFPLAIERPARFANKRIVLVGEAAHVLPPIGAQGLNMGLRDAADIADIVRERSVVRRGSRRAPGLARFETARRSDVLSRTFAIDMANRSLLSDFLPAQTARALGLHMIGRSARSDALPCAKASRRRGGDAPYSETRSGRS